VHVADGACQAIADLFCCAPSPGALASMTRKSPVLLDLKKAADEARAAGIARSARRPWTSTAAGSARPPPPPAMAPVGSTHSPAPPKATLDPADRKGKPAPSAANQAITGTYRVTTLRKLAL